MAEVKASVLHGAKDLRVESRSLASPSADEVQVAVQATGLCGSDLHYHGHYRNGDILVREPMTLGHESAGTVTAVGSGASGLQVGDRVALEVGLPCESCALCQSGRYNICRGMNFRSSAKAFPHSQGTLQERINHPAKWCHKLPPAVSLEQGALVEPLSVAFHAHSRAGLTRETAADATILILGAGAVGLCCAYASRVLWNPKRIVIADIQTDRVDFAVQNGFADVAVTVPLGRPQSIEDKLEYARGVADLVKTAKVPGSDGEVVGEVAATFECTGVETCMQAAIYSTQPGGKVMMIGMGTPIQTLPLSAAALREVDLVGVFRYANTYPKIIELLANPPASSSAEVEGGSSKSRIPDITKLITQRYKGLENIPKAFDMASKVKDEQGNLVIKVFVDMSE
ncbi:sorbitol dehydrogenase [Microdochium trichocladiopsis]|uniref:Sorbitol dehydrogenase n=1 Tax=Microdochium trichocladiopsis TaxID=1682393 RepID=A0A9P8XUQ3_9PEZI|nr:sorbitol dehydrogenase [Microdochium trichocladiopsis]KAH7018250.1 sorbitol dehydrogenase [Microdochium trichocladiopsis]